MLATSAFPQEKEEIKEIKNVASFYPINLLVSSIKIGYEFPANEKVNLKLIGTLMAANESTYFDADSLFNYGLEIQPRYYLHRSRNNDHSFYMAPYLMFNSAKFSWRKSVTDTVTWRSNLVYYRKNVGAVSAGYIFGYQVLFNSNVGVDFYAGGGYNYAWGFLYWFDGGYVPYWRGFSPHIGVAVSLALP